MLTDMSNPLTSPTAQGGRNEQQQEQPVIRVKLSPCDDNEKNTNHVNTDKAFLLTFPIAATIAEVTKALAAQLQGNSSNNSSTAAGKAPTTLTLYIQDGGETTAVAGNDVDAKMADGMHHGSMDVAALGQLKEVELVSLPAGTALAELLGASTPINPSTATTNGSDGEERADATAEMELFYSNKADSIFGCMWLMLACACCAGCALGQACANGCRCCAPRRRRRTVVNNNVVFVQQQQQRRRAAPPPPVTYVQPVVAVPAAQQAPGGYHNVDYYPVERPHNSGAQNPYNNAYNYDRSGGTSDSDNGGYWKPTKSTAPPSYPSAQHYPPPLY